MARYFSSRLIGIHLFALAAVTTCLWLGNWQWQRAQTNVQVVTVNGQTDFQTLSPLRNYLPPSSVGVPTTVTGTWQPDGRIVFENRPANGELLTIENQEQFAQVKKGVWVLDILNLETGSSVAVVHSWLPTADEAQELTGQVTVEGVLQPSELALTQTLVELPNYITTEVIVKKAISTVHDGYFVSAKPIIGNQKVSPIVPVAQETKLQWRNVIYTGNWIIFAIIIGAMWWRIIQEEVEPSNKQLINGVAK